MCNLYAIMEARAEVARLARAMTDRNNNQPPMPSGGGGRRRLAERR